MKVRPNVLPGGVMHEMTIVIASPASATYARMSFLPLRKKRSRTKIKIAQQKRNSSGINNEKSGSIYLPTNITMFSSVAAIRLTSGFGYIPIARVRMISGVMVKISLAFISVRCSHFTLNGPRNMC